MRLRSVLAPVTIALALSAAGAATALADGGPAPAPAPVANLNFNFKGPICMPHNDTSVFAHAPTLAPASEGDCSTGDDND